MSRRSARLALHILSPLIPDLISAIFALLPVDARLRCREVCRGWRAFLADARHWQVLDLSLTSGVARRTLALLRAASARAQGTLLSLDVSGWFNEPVGQGEETLEDKHLRSILRANTASLLELRVSKPVDNEDCTVETTATFLRLLTAAPRLRLLECDASVEGEEARGPLPRLLHEPQFAALRLQRLQIDAENVEPPPDVAALAVWAANHTSLKCLALFDVLLDSEAALEAVVNLALSQLHLVRIFHCGLSPASLPSLMRMLESQTLVDLLRVFNHYSPLLVGAAMPAFCTALRASRLVRLELEGMRLWESHADGLAVIDACTAHPTLRSLLFDYNFAIEDAPDRAAIEAALDALEASIRGLHLTR